MQHNIYSLVIILQNFWKLTSTCVFFSLQFSLHQIRQRCKMKRPLVVPSLGEFYFYAQSLQTLSQGSCMSNIREFEQPVHEKIFKNLPCFVPYWVPIGASPWFLQTWIPKDASYHIWFTSIRWFRRRSQLMEKFTNGWDMITIAHLSLRITYIQV